MNDDNLRENDTVMFTRLRGGWVGSEARILRMLSVSAVAILFSVGVSHAAPWGYDYISPLPGSRLVSPRNNIVFRPASRVDKIAWVTSTLTVVGGQSGVHSGELIVSTDGKTLIFQPDRPFALGETVDVQLEASAALPALAFDFTVSPIDPSQQPNHPLCESLFPEASGSSDRPQGPSTSLLNPVFTPWDTLPPGYPPIHVLTYDNPDSGCVFLTPFNSGIMPIGHLLILDNYGMPMFYRQTQNTVFDLKMQPNGLLTYYDGVFHAMNDAYQVVDTFATGNGYVTDGHELQLLPNGNALLMAYDPQPFPMDTIVPGGDPNAIVTGLIVQEIDAAKNVVFQWRSWDHFEVTDVTAGNISLTSASIDYVHGNSIDVDVDGNLLISSRNIDEITKIDRQTGDVIWRFGLHAKNNEFAFLNDTRGFRGQHDARRQEPQFPYPFGGITLFDNGNYLSPLYSRALEYQLDEVLKTAELVWEYRATPDIYGAFMGNTQRRPNGATTIAWGGTTPDPKLTELHEDGTVAFEVGFDNQPLWTYRGFRFPWSNSLFAVDTEILAMGTVAVGDSSVVSFTVSNPQDTTITITRFASTDLDMTVQAPLPITLAPGEEATVNAIFKPTTIDLFLGNVYVRSQNDTDLVAQAIPFWGIADFLADAPAGAAAPLAKLHPSAPNPFKRRTSIHFDLAKAGHVLLDVYDVHGRKVETLVDGERAAGRYEQDWRPHGLESGMYLLRLKTGDLVQTRKVVLAK